MRDSLASDCFFLGCLSLQDGLELIRAVRVDGKERKSTRRTQARVFPAVSKTS